MIARFTQEDTYRGDGLNLYAYCANNPVRYVDPSGHWCEKKEDIYRGLVEKNGLDINNIDPDTRQRLMAEASNEVRRRKKAASSEGKHTPRLPGPAADTPDDGRRGAGESNADLPQQAGKGQSRGGRHEPANLNEKLAMEEAMTNPESGMSLEGKNTDPRWPAEEGWEKWVQNVNGYEIHYQL